MKPFPGPGAATVPIDSAGRLHQFVLGKPQGSGKAQSNAADNSPLACA